jgi:hypothetical protein
MGKPAETCWSIQLKPGGFYEVLDSYGMVPNFGKFIGRFKVDSPLTSNIKLRHTDLYVFKKHGKQQFETKSVYFGATPNLVSKYGTEPAFTVRLESSCYAETIEGLFAAGFPEVEESIAKAIAKVGA